MRYQNVIKIENGKRGGKPTIRGLRITVDDVLKMLASGMTFDDIVADYPDLTTEDIKAALSFASEREHGSLILSHEVTA